MRDLAGRRLLVTGATGCLGGAAVAELRARGARVVGLARRETPGAVLADLTDPESVRTGVRAATELLGGLDAVVHCAGVGAPADVGREPTDADRQVMDVNVWGAWRVTSAALPELVAARGQVVFVASMLAYVAVPFAAGYEVSKRALAGYADVLRAEYGSHLAVTTVYPGHVDTPMQEVPRRVGVSMDSKAPTETVGQVVGALVEVLTAAAPPRDVGATPHGDAGLFLGRRLPGLVAAVVDAQMAEHVAGGRFDAAPLAAGLRERLRATAGERRNQDPLGAPVAAASLERLRRFGSEVVARIGDPAGGVDVTDGRIDPRVAGAVWGMLDPLLAQVAAVLADLPDGPLVPPDELAAAGRHGKEMLGRLGEVLVAGLLGPVPAGPDEPAAPSLLDPRVLAAAVLALQEMSRSMVGRVFAEATAAETG